MSERTKATSMEIKRLSIPDLPLRVEWMNNPLIYSSMHFSVPVLLDQTIEWFKRNQLRDDRVDFVFRGCDGETEAYGGITSINRDIGKGETYIFTNPSSHNKGIGTEAMNLLCQYGFEELGLNKLYAYTNEDNKASLRLHQKVGFIIEGRLRQEYQDASGVLKDRYYLGFLRDNYIR